MTLFVAVVTQWIMPLFFTLSGMSAYYSLNSRSVGRYLRNRAQRLVIPLVFASFVVLIPAQVWVERVSHQEFDGSFIEFYPHYFDGWYAFGGNFAWMGLHLWYLQMLFLFTLLTLPLFLVLKRERTRQRIARAIAPFQNRGAIFLLGLPFLIMEAFINLWRDGIGVRVFGGWSLASYLILLILGFLLASDRRYQRATEKARWVALALGIVTTIEVAVLPEGLVHQTEWVNYGLMVFMRSLSTWAWLVALLGFGSKYLQFRHRTLNDLRAAALPFYILHQTVIVVLGFYMVSWDMSVMLKFLMLSVMAFTTIVLTYEVLIKRVALLRWLFGMKMSR